MRRAADRTVRPAAFTLAGLVVAAGLFMAAPADALCIEVDRLRQLMADAGLSIAYAATVEVRETTMPAYVAIGRNGVWIAYFVYRDALACIIAAGRQWTEQGAIPPADLRPSPGHGEKRGG